MKPCLSVTHLQISACQVMSCRPDSSLMDRLSQMFTAMHAMEGLPAFMCTKVLPSVEVAHVMLLHAPVAPHLQNAVGCMSTESTGMKDACCCTSPSLQKFASKLIWYY